MPGRLAVPALVLAALSTLFAGAASASFAHLCDRAATLAARESGVPEAVLFALTRTETGRGRNGRLEPWPWTVNMEGEGRWFESKADAIAYVEGRRRTGARSFDVGCFQINHRWHGDAFPSIEAMFDPVENARYAARFLVELREELSARSGDWLRIAGAYHSRTPHFAEAYRARFAQILDALRGPDGDGPLLADAPILRRAAPLFAAGGGSLARPLPREEGGPTAGGAGMLTGGGGTGLLRPTSGPLTGPRDGRT